MLTAGEDKASALAGKFRNVVPKSAEAKLKKSQADAWTYQI